MSAVNDAHECLIVKLVHGCSKNEKIKSCVILQFVLTVQNIYGIQGCLLVLENKASFLGMEINLRYVVVVGNL